MKNLKKYLICLDTNREPEILLELNDESYIITKYNNKITFGRSNSSKIFEFKNLEQLYISKIDNICLREDWNKIEDILIDLTFSVLEDKEELEKIYEIKL